MFPPIDVLRRRRDGYARYAQLLVAQVQAIDAEDFERFHDLARERDIVAKEIDAAADEAGTVAAAADAREDAQEVERLLAEVRVLLESCRDHDRRLRERIERLRDQALDAVRTMDRRRPHVHGYLHSGEAAAPRVDVRL